MRNVIAFMSLPLHSTHFHTWGDCERDLGLHSTIEQINVILYTLCGSTETLKLLVSPDVIIYDDFVIQSQILWCAFVFFALFHMFYTPGMHRRFKSVLEIYML